MDRTSETIRRSGLDRWSWGNPDHRRVRVEVRPNCLPTSRYGGDAAEFYMYMQRNWKSEFSPGIDLSKFQLVAREAPQVAARLIDLLDGCKIQQIKNQTS